MSTPHELPDETPAEQDPAGRPLSVEGRLEAIVSILVGDGIEPARSTLHAMLWWEESMSPVLGLSVGSSGWVRTDEGPRSPAADEVLDRWTREGLWTVPDGEPLLSEAMEARNDLVEAGNAWSGVGVRTFRHAPSDFLPWYRMLCGFVQGLHDGDGPRPDSFDSARDFRRMLASDPVNASEAWEECGGPGLLRTAPVGDVAMPDFRGNGASYAMACWKTLVEGLVPGRPAARDDFEAAFLWARFLVARAAKAHSEFGSAVFSGLRDALSAEEKKLDDGTVEARFLLDGEQVATAAWRPRRKPVETTTPKGSLHRFEVDDGDLLSLRVEDGFRRRGIGTYVLRHAQTRGCVRAPDPSPEATTLWSRHGRPSPDGGWTIGGVSWPTCATTIADPSADPSLPSSSPAT